MMRDIRHSALIVSSSGQFNAAVMRFLSGFPMTDYRKSGAAARRCIQERYYDIVIINAPLPDETGEQLAVYITQQCSASVLFVISSDRCEDILDQMTDRGILVLPKPFPHDRLGKAIRFLSAVQDRIHSLEKQAETMHERMEELRIVTKAKFLLVEHRHMSEDEAHRLIGKQAMDHGTSRKRIAQRILDDYEG